MAGETSQISRMAEYVSDELLSWFKWQRIALKDQNFDCVKVAKHSQKEKHTHPVDAVFWYDDPYLNKRILLNTDLKSYASGSIDASKIYPALKSISQTIDCAKVSDEWLTRYELTGGAFEVRGMLFVYNHDANYDGSFYELLSRPVQKRGRKVETPYKLDQLPIQPGQSVHILEPQLISYLSTVVADANSLHRNGTFPETTYEFYYPELKLHKTHGARFDRPATVEMLAGPFLIIRHDQVIKFNESTKVSEERYPSGVVIYYNRPGASPEEFMYFLDILSNYQLLDGAQKVRVRFACHQSAQDIHSNFKRAKLLYAREWGFDVHKMNRLDDIEVASVEVVKHSFSRTNIGWER